MNTSSIHRWLADGFVAGEQVTSGRAMADPNYRGVAGPHCSGGIAGVSADAGDHHEIQRFTDGIAACKAWRTRSGITSTRTAQRLGIKVVEQQPDSFQVTLITGGSMTQDPKKPSNVGVQYPAHVLPEQDAHISARRAPDDGRVPPSPPDEIRRRIP